MKNLILILLTCLFWACQDMTSLTDLSPENGFESEYWFDVPAFIDAIESANNVVPGDVHRVGDPKYLSTRVPDLIDTAWYVTDTFAFEEHDYSAVVNSIVSTAEWHVDSGTRTIVPDWDEYILLFDRTIPINQVNHKWLNWNGWRAYSGNGYYLFQIGKVWIRIDRVKDEDKSNWFINAYRYTAFGIWLIGEREETEGDVS